MFNNKERKDGVKMKKALLGVVAAAGAFAAIGAVVYENDFSTRVSAEPIPYSGWRQVPYVTGRLVNDRKVTPFDGNDIQDGWIAGENSNTCKTYAYVVDDAGNQGVILCGDSSTGRNVLIRQRLGNSFTTGIVTAQCDIKPPTSWVYSSLRSFRFALGDESFFSPITDSSPSDINMEYIASGVGISMTTGGKYKFFRYGTNLDAAAEAKSDVWYRIVVTANLDTKKYSVAFYEMGESHPTLDAATPASAVHTEDGLDFRSVTKNHADANGVSAMGFFALNTAGTTNAADRTMTAQVDNIRLWHDGVECYVNDFTARRSRNLATGSAVATYTPASLVTNTYGYAADTVVVPARDGSKSKQDVGFDGWRRLNDSTGNPSVSVYTNDNALKVGTATSTPLVGQPLGQTVSGGIVRATIDARVSESASDATAMTEFLLGGDAMYDSVVSGNGYNAGVFARGSVRFNEKEAGTTDKCLVRWGSNAKMTTSTKGVIVDDKWFRMEFVADLDNGKYSYTIYNVCSATKSPAMGAAAGEVLFTTNNLAAYRSQDGISAVALDCFYGVVYFDNLCVWHKPTGASSETMVYSNSFDERNLYGCDGAEDMLVGEHRKNPVGIDGWMRQYKVDSDYFVIGGENNALGFGVADAASSAFVTHDLGGAYGHGKIEARFDVCAPSAWANDNSGIHVWLGGDQYHEGNMNGGSSGPNYFLRWTAFGVGLNGRSMFECYRGDGNGGGALYAQGTATAGHWYRFVVKSNFMTSLSDIDIYDMGTSQPTLSTATPSDAPVQTFSSVPFRQSAANLGDATCIGIQVRGSMSASPLTASDHRLLLDNVSIKYKPCGSIIMVF